ncbi:MAG: hypothetical protein FJY25_11830 [Betaproteobacteria bacterium]|nr:hypothetical protein [Betaproteobacteria bacterium]
MTRCNITCATRSLQFKTRLRGPLAALTLTAWLTGCGGGGGGSTPTPVTPPDPRPVIAGCSLLYPVSGAAPQPGLPDPLLGAQWHLRPADSSTGEMGLGATLAWRTSLGKGVRVAVIDGPVETLHGDLAANMPATGSFDYRLNTATAPLPCAPEDAHGTAVAGILAAARGNGLAGAGVAPAATVVAYNAIEAGVRAELTRQRIADALTRSDSHHLYNLSWGSDDDGALHAADTAVIQAIDQGIRRGRGGLGTLYVFASGNGGCLTIDGRTDPDPRDPTRCRYRDMTGFDGHLNLPGAITACAVDRTGRLPLWGEEGENLLVCGLSSDSAGGNAITTLAPGNTTRSNFGGASAAAPMVSGVIALMLEVNPSLSWRDIRLILAETARENQPLDPSWSSTALDKWPPQTVNAQPVRKRFSRRFGFGVVDAEAAVERARTLGASVGTHDTLTTCEFSSTPAIGLPDFVDPDPNRPDGRTWRSDTITVGAVNAPGNACGISQIELVEVIFSATHRYAADLEIELVGPGGVSRLADSRFCGGTSRRDQSNDQDRCGSYTNWRFLANRHIAESSQGAWTLRVADAVLGETGTWQSWTLRLSGR